MSNPPLLSRIILVISSIIVVGVVFFFASSALEPVPVQPPPPARSAAAFNPKADISKHPVFPQLETKDMVEVPDLPMGRQNPFLGLSQSASTRTLNMLPGTNIRALPPAAESETGAVIVGQEQSTSSLPSVTIPVQTSTSTLPSL